MHDYPFWSKTRTKHQETRDHMEPKSLYITFNLYVPKGQKISSNSKFLYLLVVLTKGNEWEIEESKTMTVMNGGLLLNYNFF